MGDGEGFLVWGGFLTKVVEEDFCFVRWGGWEFLGRTYWGREDVGCCLDDEAGRAVVRGWTVMTDDEIALSWVLSAGCSPPPPLFASSFLFIHCMHIWTGFRLVFFSRFLSSLFLFHLRPWLYLAVLGVWACNLDSGHLLLNSSSCVVCFVLFLVYPCWGCCSASLCFSFPASNTRHWYGDGLCLRRI